VAALPEGMCHFCLFLAEAAGKAWPGLGAGEAGHATLGCLAAWLLRMPIPERNK